jgi:hypothetical protein
MMRLAQISIMDALVTSFVDNFELGNCLLVPSLWYVPIASWRLVLEKACFFAMTKR